MIASIGNVFVDVIIITFIIIIIIITVNTTVLIIIFYVSFQHTFRVSRDRHTRLMQTIVYCFLT